MWGRQPQPSGDPPRYQKVMNRYALRFPLILTAGLGFVWAVAMGAGAIKDLGDTGETAKMKLFDIIIGALYFAVAAVELYMIVVASMQNLRFAKLFRILAPLGIGLAIAGQVMVIVAHFTLKGDLINQCTSDYTGGTASDGYGNYRPISSQEATTICTNSWERRRWVIIVWLFVVIGLSLFFASVAMTYLRQLISPPPPQQQAFQMQPQQPYPHNPPPPHGQGGDYGPPPSQQQSWMVPPYPGPPPQGIEPFEKSDYHPSAEWAQNPPNSSGWGGAGRRDVEANRPEEEAWARAQSEGVTAHLTGHAPNPARRGEAQSGYVIGNREEDEAWERARDEGVTAHMTGHAKPRRDQTDV